jgi:TolB-like protein
MNLPAETIIMKQCLTIIIAISLILCIGCGNAARNKAMGPAPAQQVVADLSRRCALLAKDKSIRLAVQPFTPTQPQFTAEAGCGFGAYFTEGLIGALGANPEKIRLFERSRLDAITKENALSLTGLLSQDEARKIGELAPIDYILTGTFTKLASFVEVNGRILDVVSGEIKVSFSQRLELTPDIASLFPAHGALSGSDRRVTTPEEGKDETPASSACPPQVALLDSLLDNLTTKEKIDKCVVTALTVPFVTPCGDIHGKVLRHFTRYKIFDAAYKRFLIATLKSMDKPENANYEYGSMIFDIFKYFQADSVIDKEEWEAGIAILERSSRLHDAVVSSMFVWHRPEAEMAVQYKRIDELFSLVKQQKFGLPVALTYDEAFSSIVSALKGWGNAPDNRLAIYCLSKHADGLSDKGRLRTYEKVEALYRSVTDRFQTIREKRQVIELICNNFNAMAPSEGVAEKMLGMGKVLVDLIQSSGAPDSIRNAAADHMKYYAATCGKQLAASLHVNKSLIITDDDILFCIANDIPAGDIVPSIDTLMQRLGSEDIRVQMAAAKYLDAMGSKAARAEGKVLKTLRRAERSPQSGSTNLRWSLINVLGNIKTKNPEALDVLIKALADNDYEVPDHAMKALAKIGRPAIGPLKDSYGPAEDFVKIRIVKTLAIMGKEAASEIPFLRTQLRRAENHDVHDEIEDAVEKLEQASR